MRIVSLSLLEFNERKICKLRFQPDFSLDSMYCQTAKIDFAQLVISNAYYTLFK